jgi:hypothetical protein
MGRSPFFTLSNVPLLPTLPSSVQLKQLKVGDKIKISFSERTDEKAGFPARSVSTYDYVPSPLSTELVYVITNTDVCSSFHEIGLNLISVISASHLDPSNHMDGWYITTDGYIRECEHFGILYKIDSIEIC